MKLGKKKKMFFEDQKVSLEDKAVEKVFRDGMKPRKQKDKVTKLPKNQKLFSIRRQKLKSFSMTFFYLLPLKL